jgi:REP element-mobilizing transposase RayT
MQAEGWQIGEACIMPNHLHFLILRQQSDFSLQQVIRRFKGRSGRWINKALGRTGKFWKEEWFYRWMRDDAERTKTIAYIRNNPVKA